VTWTRTATSPVRGRRAAALRYGVTSSATGARSSAPIHAPFGASPASTTNRPPIAPVPDPAGWFHARIEVGRTTVQVFVDGAARPTLAVPRLGSASGGVGLWVDSQEGSFANLQIRLAS
jgi:hypothetical protein